MKDYILTFKTAVRRAKDDDISDDSEFVNNFMWEHQLYGEDTYNRLMLELQKTIEFKNALREVAENHGFSITPRSSCINREEANFYGTAFV